MIDAACVLPVLDVLDGQAVHAVAGQRRDYRPLASPWAANADVLDIAQGLRRRFGFQELYLADLDGILQQRPNVDLWRRLADAGYARIWIDCGLDVPRRGEALASQSWPCPLRWIVGLESLAAPQHLHGLRQALGPEAVFSLDLKDGQPLCGFPPWRSRDPLEIASDVQAAGYQDLIVLDLASVGVRQGPTTLNLCRSLRQAAAGLTLTTGGGVRGARDVQRCLDAGCRRVLAATALHQPGADLEFASQPDQAFRTGPSD